MGSPPALVVKAKNRVPLVPQKTLRHIGFSAVPFPFIDGNVMSGKDCAKQSVLCDRGRGSSSKHRRQPDFAATARRPSYSKIEMRTVFLLSSLKIFWNTMHLALLQPYRQKEKSICIQHPHSTRQLAVDAKYYNFSRCSKKFLLLKRKLTHIC